MEKEPLFLGIEIGGSKLQLVKGNADGKLLAAYRFPVKKEEGAAGIRRTIEKTIREHFREGVKAAGIGFGGPVNWKTGEIAASFHIEGWSDFNLVNWLEPIIEAPVFVDNDANTAALGEAMHGAGKGYACVLYITIGSGIGGGLTIHNDIFHGAIPGETEIGHLRMDRSGDILESRCSGWAVDRKIREIVAQEPDGVLAKLTAGHGSGEARFLKAALDRQDPAAWKLFETMTDDFAFGLSHAVHLLHPEVIVLGGGISLIGELWRQHIERKLEPYLMKTFHPAPPVRLAALKEQAVTVGALALAASMYFNHNNKE
ncbi:MAG TPA: ROK family protein [Flavitalea sp.]|nr:ROK family protein [Flavitalea sp.]